MEPKFKFFETHKAIFQNNKNTRIILFGTCGNDLEIFDSIFKYIQTESPNPAEVVQLKDGYLIRTIYEVANDNK